MISAILKENFISSLSPSMTVIPLPFLSFFSSDITLLKTNAAPRFDEEKAEALMPAELTVTTNEMMIAVTNFFIKNGLP